jgi:hypothetical protein
LPATTDSTQVVDVLDVDAVARNRRAVGLDLQAAAGQKSARLSRLPRRCILPTTRAIFSASVLSVSRSSPKSLMATSERTPEINSATRNSIGCEKLKAAPGTLLL